MASKDAESTCTNCEDVVPSESILKCVTCSDKVADPQQPLELLCGDCVKSHVKKSHKLADSRGFEPSVCREHNQLSSEFCKTCEKLCCVKCLRDHRKHEFEPLKEKATEIRAKVFEALTRWELYEKPARAQKELVSTVIISQKEDVEKLLSYIEKKIDEMKTNVVREIQSNLVDLEDSVKEIEDHILNVVDLQQELRSLLQTSEGAMVEKFGETLKVLDNRLERHKQIEILKFDDYDQIPDAGCLDVETSFVEVKKELKKAAREKQDCFASSKSCLASAVIHRSYFSKLDGHVILIESSQIGFNICQFSVDSGAQLINQQKISATFVPMCLVSFIYYIDDSFILILFEDKSTVLLSSLTGKEVKDIHAPYPLLSNFITPFIVANKVEWICWDASIKALLSTYDESHITCCSKPNNHLSTFSSDYLGYFETRTKKAIAIRRRDGILVAEMILFSVHRLNVIDHVTYLKSCTGTIYMVLWSKESNLSLIFNQMAKGTFVVKEKVDWSCGPVIETFILKKYLVPEVFSDHPCKYIDAFLVCNEPPSVFQEEND